MPDLRFDTDQGHDTVSQLRSILESVRTESETIRSRVDNLVGADWEAPAAHAFQSEMANWYQNIASTLTFLEDLINRLTMEIQQWEETAAQLGGGAIGAATTGGFPSGYGGTPSGYDSMGICYSSRV
ncbi:MAG: hypothetical protein B6242_13410 [Anaerolineaceae bacterium 4572_78]|nr:MAG: hypothetical protein B6242_13410 [Anaerolineaceae bacterium 4572_78]